MTRWLSDGVGVTNNVTNGVTVQMFQVSFEIFHENVISWLPISRKWAHFFTGNIFGPGPHPEDSFWGRERGRQLHAEAWSIWPKNVAEIRGLNWMPSLKSFYSTYHYWIWPHRFDPKMTNDKSPCQNISVVLFRSKNSARNFCILFHPFNSGFSSP